MVKSKKNEFKLYDMDSDVQEWRVGNFQRGDSWRSDEIYRCKLCHTKTNNWQMGGWPGMGPRLICPGSGYKEHKHLTELFELYLDIEKDVARYASISSEAPPELKEKSEQLIDNFKTKKELLEFKLNKMRKLFLGKVDDVELLDATAAIRDYYPRCIIMDPDKTLDDVE